MTKLKSYYEGTSKRLLVALYGDPYARRSEAHMTLLSIWALKRLQKKIWEEASLSYGDKLDIDLALQMDPPYDYMVVLTCCHPKAIELNQRTGFFRFNSEDMRILDNNFDGLVNLNAPAFIECWTRKDSHGNLYRNCQNAFENTNYQPSLKKLGSDLLHLARNAVVGTATNGLPITDNSDEDSYKIKTTIIDPTAQHRTEVDGEGKPKNYPTYSFNDKPNRYINYYPAGKDGPIILFDYVENENIKEHWKTLDAGNIYETINEKLYYGDDFIYVDDLIIPEDFKIKISSILSRYRNTHSRSY